MLSKLIANSIYVQIRKNAFHLRHIEEKRDLDVFADKPFTTTRLLFGNFTAGVKILDKGVRELTAGSKSFFRPSPVIVMHPLEMVEGGLSDVEERAYIEAAFMAGARSAFVHVGAILQDAEVLALISQPMPAKLRR